MYRLLITTRTDREQVLWQVLDVIASLIYKYLQKGKAIPLQA